MQVEAWLQRAACSAPTLTAIQTPDARLSYGELWSAVRAGAVELAERGARPGARVAIALAPGIAFAQALHACMLLGAVAVPVDLRLTDAERERIAAGASVVIDEPLLANAGMPVEPDQPEALGRPERPGSLGESGQPGSDAPGSSGQSALPSSGGPAEGASYDQVFHDLDAVCAVIYTSGTTSAPQPVELTYGNFLWSAFGSGVALGVDPQERWLCALPVSHVGGLSIFLRSAIYATTAVVHERFDTDAVLGALQEDRITLVSLVSTTLARLLDAGLRDPPCLRCALTGGGPVPAALVQRARAAGVPVIETYGLTECCSQAATAPLAVLAGAARGSAEEGQMSASTDVATPDVATPDVATPNDAGAGVPLFCTRIEIAPDGEIVLSGPTVARGSHPERHALTGTGKQASKQSADGRLHTGDLGHIDAGGFLHVSGRKADTIVTGGENVAPSEVEAVLEAHPAVLEAAVLGREDPRWGEAVTAIVVLAPQASVGESALRAHCSQRLAPFKVPKRVEITSTPLPRTRSGKLLRRDLRGDSAMGTVGTL
jgi:O-succinylbenzoic acid--CoA ligase